MNFDVKLECIKRMELLKLNEEIIKHFEKDNTVRMSAPPYGSYYGIDEDIEKRIKEIENFYNVKVYHVVRKQEFNQINDYYLYVTEKDEFWEYDKKDISLYNCIVCCRYNLTNPLDIEMNATLEIETLYNGCLRPIN